jgi:hypothetical protein
MKPWKELADSLPQVWIWLNCPWGKSIILNLQIANTMLTPCTPSPLGYYIPRCTSVGVVSYPLLSIISKSKSPAVVCPPASMIVPLDLFMNYELNSPLKPGRLLKSPSTRIGSWQILQKKKPQVIAIDELGVIEHPVFVGSSIAKEQGYVPTA